MESLSEALQDIAKTSYLRGRYDTLEALAESLKEAFATLPNPIVDGILHTLEINKLETSLKIGTTNE